MLSPFFYEAANRTQFGISSEADHIFISHMDWIFLDLVLAAHPHWTNLVETGTSYGLTSLYLGTVAKLRGGELHTFDIRDQRRSRVLAAWPDCTYFHPGDILAETSDELVSQIGKPLTFVFFDNGEKLTELNMYAGHLTAGSGFIVHDCGYECRESDVIQVAEKYGCEPFMLDIALDLGTSCRAFVRADD